MRWLVVLALVSPLAGCVLYTSDDDVIECDDADYVPLLLLDPSNLTCQDHGGYQCGDALAVPLPSWGRCDSACRDLGEEACYGASGCRLVYDWACYTGEGPCNDSIIPFVGCFPVDESGPTQGACDGLDAWSCSVHDDCIALHDSQSDGDAFIRCVPEGR